MQQRTLTDVLRLDAAANALGGITLLATGDWLADPMGLASAWPLWSAGLALIVNAIGNQLVAHRTTAGRLSVLAAVDLLFAVTDPTGAETWARWGLVGIADLSAAVGITKLVGVRSLAGATDARSAIT